MAIQYDVFRGDNSGGPVDYSARVGTTSGLSFTPDPLPPGSRTWFGLRARDGVTGYSEANTDVRVLVVVGPAGEDLALVPDAPHGLRAYAGQGGKAVVEWVYASLDRSRLPTAFDVFLGTGGAPNYAAPAATLTRTVGAGVTACRVVLTGLVEGVVYSVGVRSKNAAGTEPNTTAVSVTGRTAAPAAVTSLAASAAY